ncbi:polyprenyl synthetase family protein [Vagococcus lutrae]|uniref:Farnesyl diphosphate synthase n=1 Tax=Vagococcus lutrae TaxID=81947 RepID=A0AAE9XHJ6_9ENTE|nr:farnesyl diphosphate synthase [Vagococcus lutrae]WCG23547.1 polyprenyl synthetase family protein [Vagococcus lutrae]
MKTVNSTEFMTAYRNRVDETMSQHIQSVTSEPSLKEAMMYSVSAGGKRIRPLLLLATVAFFDAEITQAQVDVAAAIEMVHTYSLIHDDLPAMDDDDLRRGKPTNHKVYGEALAILAGDALLTEAFHLIGCSALPADLRVEAMTQLAWSSGANGMVAGQVADMEGEQQQLPLEQLSAVHQRKTGRLLALPLTLGAMLTQQPFETVSRFTEMGNQLGLAFQIRDDILDVVGSTDELGKQTGVDAEREKSTYTSLLGLDEAINVFERTISSVLNDLQRYRKMEGSISALEAIIQGLAEIPVERKR